MISENEKNLTDKGESSAIYFHKIKWLSLLMLILLTACGGGDKSRSHTPSWGGVDHRKPLAWGHEQTIYVFADNHAWNRVESQLRSSIERYYFTTENETYFDLKRADFKNIDQFFRFKNLIFFAHLDSEQEVSRYVKDRLTANAIESVEENRVGMFTRSNLWANDQAVIFLMGDDLNSMHQYASIQRESMFEYFKERLFSRMEGRIYGYDVYPSSFFSNYPWSIKMPENYVVYKRADDDNFISFLARRKDNPDRYLSVYYEPVSENEFGLNWVVKTRERIAWAYYDEDEFTKDDTRSMSIDFEGREAVFLAGRWQNRKHAVGGAFSSYAFYDSENEMAYFIDNSVFYPQGFKLPALIELEIISRTIEINKKDSPYSEN